MKKLLLVLIFLSLLVSCKNDHGPKARYYKAAKTGKILDQASYNKLKQKLLALSKSANVKSSLHEIFTDSVVSGDSMIKTFEFKLTLGNKMKNPEAVFGYVNRKLPSHTFMTLNGKKVNPGQPQGKPTLINFWFTDCPPCIDEIPVLNRIRKKYKDRINFISITFNSREEVNLFLKSHPYDFLKVVGAQDYIDSLGIKNFPVNVFMDKTGVVKRVEDGIPYELKSGKLVMGNGKQFESYIKDLL